MHSETRSILKFLTRKNEVLYYFLFLYWGNGKDVIMYKKVPTDLKFVDREREVLKFWKDNDIFNKSIEEKKDNETYMFYDGPPTANGKPHIGRAIKYREKPVGILTVFR